MNSRAVRVWILLLTGVAGIVSMAFVPSIAQDPSYHQFADTRRLLDLPNFWNVVTNLPFVLVGLLGLLRSGAGTTADKPAAPATAYRVFCMGLILTGLGSAYYHYAPTMSSLAWDRLPMAVTFMAFLALILGDSVSPNVGRRALWPLLLAGVGSVLYWYATELKGAGDLRPYGLVQFLPMILIPLTLFLFGSRTLRKGPLWACLGLYALAKVFESLDAPLLGLARVVSGHSVKHLLAAAGAFCALLAFRGRLPSSQASDNQETFRRP